MSAFLKSTPMMTALADDRKILPESEDISRRLPLKEGERWFAARTLANREMSAQFNIRRLGFDAFFPTVRRTIRHARQLRHVRAPLFPGYGFVVLDLSRDRWRSINGVAGVASLVMGAEKPIPAPRGVVETLIAMRDNSGPVSLGHDLVVGQKVRILSGPFAEALCRLERLDDRGRVCVLLEIMGGQVAAYLERSALGPAA